VDELRGEDGLGRESWESWERNETEEVNFGSSNERRGPELTQVVKKVMSDEDNLLILGSKDENLVVRVREVV